MVAPHKVLYSSQEVKSARQTIFREELDLWDISKKMDCNQRSLFYDGILMQNKSRSIRPVISSETREPG